MLSSLPILSHNNLQTQSRPFPRHPDALWTHLIISVESLSDNIYLQHPLVQSHTTWDVFLTVALCLLFWKDQQRNYPPAYSDGFGMVDLIMERWCPSCWNIQMIFGWAKLDIYSHRLVQACLDGQSVKLKSTWKCQTSEALSLCLTWRDGTSHITE